MHDSRTGAAVGALDALTQSVAAAERAATTLRASREQSLDARRRLDVLRRQQAALQARIDRAPGGCAIVGHRQPWAATRLVTALATHGVEVTEVLVNAADVVGAAGAGQPELVVVEDRLPMMRADELVVAVLQLVPTARVVVQVEDDSDTAVLSAAGAAAVVSRRAPLEDLAAAAVSVLGRPGEPVTSTG